MWKIVLLMLPLLCMQCSVAAAQDVSQSQCQQWKDKIEHYTDLRRAGGSASQMNSWRKKQKEYGDKFYKAKCKKFGKALQ